MGSYSIPHIEEIDSFDEGREIVVKGSFPVNSRRLAITLAEGHSTRQIENLALHISIRLLSDGTREIVMNYRFASSWCDEQIYQLDDASEEFNIIVQNQGHVYGVRFNDERYKFVAPGGILASCVLIQGDIRLHSVKVSKELSGLGATLGGLAIAAAIGGIAYYALTRKDNPSPCGRENCGVSCHCNNCLCPRCRRLRNQLS